MQAFYASVLLATVAAALLPAVLFQPHSRILLLKVAAIVMFASLPGCCTCSSSGSRGRACTTNMSSTSSA
jgi:hypothetical protein